MKFNALPAATILLLLIPLTGHAQQPADVCEQCYLALQQDLYASSLSEAEALALLDVTTQATWQSQSNNASGGISFPIKGIPFGANADWSKFETARSEAFAKHSFKSDFARSLSLLTKVGNDRGFASFDNCVELCANKPGIYYWMVNNQKGTAQLKVQWRAPASNQVVRPIEVETTLQGGRVSDASVPVGKLLKPGAKLGAGETRFIEVTRTGAEPISGTLNGGGYGTAFYIPVPISAPPIHKCNEGAGAWFINPPQEPPAGKLSEVTGNVSVQVVVFDACTIQTVEAFWACQNAAGWDPPAPQGGPNWVSLGQVVPVTIGYNSFATFSWPVPTGRAGQRCQIKSDVQYPGVAKPTDNYVGIVVK